MSKMKIDGSGTCEDPFKKKNLSKRAMGHELSVEKKICPKCKHHKRFIGNSLGLAINKCCKCGARI